ncbi:MAG: serine peptidase, partial [bacterium]
MKIMQRLSGSFSAAAFAVAAVMFLPLGLGVSLSSNAVAAVLPDFTDLVDKVGPAVVNIRTTERSKGGMPQGQGAPGSEDEEMQEFFRRFFGQPPGGGGQRPQPSPRGRKGPQGGDEQSPT